jgi:hypothetical protein
MRKHLTLFNLATLILIFFDLGHTLGGILLHRSSSPAEQAVLDTMASNHFVFNGADCTYMGFHTGYGLLVTILLTLSAFLTWYLGRREGSQELRPVAWALFIAYIGVAAITWKYFFAGPGAMATLVAIILGYKCLKGSASSSKIEKNHY